MRPGPLRACLAVVALVGCSPSGDGEQSVCPQLGTFHRDSRSALERLRTRDMVSTPEWKCMAEALGELDASFTARCESAAATLDELRDAQRSAYTACLETPREAILDKAVVRRLGSG